MKKHAKYILTCLIYLVGKGIYAQEGKALTYLCKIFFNAETKVFQYETLNGINKISGELVLTNPKILNLFKEDPKIVIRTSQAVTLEKLKLFSNYNIYDESIRFYIIQNGVSRNLNVYSSSGDNPLTLKERLKNWSSNDFVYKYLSEIKNGKVLVSIPNTEEEYKNIFNEINLKQYEKTVSIRNKIKKLQNSNIKILTNKESFLQYLNSGDKSFPVFVIGHNEKGQFYFSDNSYYTFRELDSIALVAERFVIYLSCNAIDYTESLGVNYSLTYKEAFFLANLLSINIKMIDINSKKPNIVKSFILKQEKVVKSQEYFLKCLKNQHSQKKNNVKSICTNFVKYNIDLNLIYGLYLVSSEKKEDKKKTKSSALVSVPNK